uniref:RNA-directed DNA polymerase, eukaryota n=1 Tax=Tanacetum cinerariifolium TaxID=118510 RepID=A0A699KGR2_TANCI|nr:RNA-directed DNA polymerase, eukaryota [Tanacetum cinerariifolium]
MGMSGGIICLWNNLVLLKSNIICNENYVVVDGLWIPGDVHIRWITVYSPQILSNKIALWSLVLQLTVTWDGILVMMRDFNEVREAGDHYGSVFNDRQAKFFNDFIEGASLIDIPLGGYNYTWTDKWGSKMSKLDRFLVSDNFYESFPHITGVILEKGIPDHRPILLKESHKKHQEILSSIDVKIDHGTTSEDDFINRKDALKSLSDLARMEAKDLSQKAKTKWALEGIMKNDVWIKEPGIVKAEFMSHFSHRFQQPTCIPTSLDTDCSDPSLLANVTFLKDLFLVMRSTEQSENVVVIVHRDRMVSLSNSLLLFRI